MRRLLDIPAEIFFGRAQDTACPEGHTRGGLPGSAQRGSRKKGRIRSRRANQLLLRETEAA